MTAPFAERVSKAIALAFGVSCTIASLGEYGIPNAGSRLVVAIVIGIALVFAMNDRNNPPTEIGKGEG